MSRVAEKLKDTMDEAAGDRLAWQKRFEEDPMYALEWGEAAYTAVAKERVAAQCLAAFQRWTEAGASDEEAQSKLDEMLKEDVLRDARNREASTSTTSNLMKRELLVASATMRDSLHWWR